ncbi:MAG: hypothetical protein V4677_13600 [Bacteroidota bacterium]
MRAKLTLQERIKRAAKIREGKEKANTKKTAEYTQSHSFKVNKIIAFFFAAYILVTLIPYYPSFFSTQEIVTSSNFYLDRGTIIYIHTDKNSEYEIKGTTMGSHAFHEGDTIISRKNLVYKIKNIYHKKYAFSYPLDKQLYLLILFASFTTVLIIMVLSKDYRMERFHTNITLITIIFFLIYLTS